MNRASGAQMAAALGSGRWGGRWSKPEAQVREGGGTASNAAQKRRRVGDNRDKISMFQVRRLAPLAFASDIVLGDIRAREMSWSINLRSDLAKLSDAELAAELNRLQDYRQTRFGTAPAVGTLAGVVRHGIEWPFGRGPIRARWAYKIWIGYFWIFRGPRGTLYLVECEIKDLQDEIGRRAAVRKRAPWCAR